MNISCPFSSLFLFKTTTTTTTTATTTQSTSSSVFFSFSRISPVLQDVHHTLSTNTLLLKTLPFFVGRSLLTQPSTQQPTPQLDLSRLSYNFWTTFAMAFVHDELSNFARRRQHARRDALRAPDLEKRFSPTAIFPTTTGTAAAGGPPTNDPTSPTTTNNPPPTTSKSFCISEHRDDRHLVPSSSRL